MKDRQMLRTLIVDDEPHAVRLIESYVNRMDSLELVCKTHSSIEAIKVLDEGNIDLAFVDIQMPELTGLQLAKIVQGKCHLIFTTAYPQYAAESYSLQATDYLLKPISFERFHEAVSKISTSEKVLRPLDSFFVKTDGKNQFMQIRLNDIVYIEGLQNYVAIHTVNQRIVTYNTMKNLCQTLPDDFIQIHRSFIVSLSHVIKTDNDVVFVDKKELPLGNTYKKVFFERIRKRQL